MPDKATVVAWDGPLLVIVVVKVRLTPTAAGLGEAETATAMSAEAVAVKLLMAVLLEGKGSGSLAETFAVLVKLPGAKALTTRVIAWKLPLVMLPTLHVKAGAPVQVVPPALTKVRPPGRVSVRVTPVAVEGPLLVMV